MNISKTVIHPYNLIAEEAAISSILKKPTIARHVMSPLCVNDFQGLKNRLIFSCIKALFNKQGFVTVPGLVEELKVQRLFKTIGGAPELKRLAALNINPENADYYAGIVKEKARERRQQQEAEERPVRGGHQGEVLRLANKYRLRPSSVYNVITSLKMTKGVEFNKRGARYELTADQVKILESELQRHFTPRKQDKNPTT